MNKRWIAGVVVAIATLVVAIATLAVAVGTWLFPNPLGRGEEPKRLATEGATPESHVAIQTPRQGGSISRPSDGRDQPPTTSQEVPRPVPTSTLLPLELNLTDGEQSVILSGQAGLAVEFNRVGEEQFVTLRIRAGSTSKSHAILSSTATKRYKIELQGEEYYVSVLRIDHSARSVRLRVDRKRDL